MSKEKSSIQKPSQLDYQRARTEEKLPGRENMTKREQIDEG
jgi:hypothetical protein